MWFEEHKADLVVNVLGTEYGLWMNVPEEEDKPLEHCSGYCDKTTKRIVIAKVGKECTLGNPSEYVKYVIRHELIHAFLFESGIGGDTTWDIPGEEHPEHMVQWIAMQFPKIMKLFETIGVL